MEETTAKINIELVIFSRIRNSISLTGAITENEEMSLSMNPNSSVNRIIKINRKGSYFRKNQDAISATSLT